MTKSTLMYSLKKSLFDQSTHDEIKNQLAQNHLENVSELKAELEEDYLADFASEEFQETLFQILDDKSLQKFTPMGFEFLHLIENYFFLAWLHESYENGENEEGEFEILDFWQDTIFNESFMDLFEKNQNEVQTSLKLKHILENQILSFYYLHLNTGDLQKGTLLYPLSYDHGDFEERVYLGESESFIFLDQKRNPIDVFPSIPVHYVPPHKRFVEVDMGTKIISLDVHPVDSFVEMDDLKLFIHPSSSEFIQDGDKQMERISTALNIIKEASPHCFQTFKSFTNVVVPIDDPSIVSYSNQYLPGYSTINVVNRDFVDLLDDLIHENGHHYLNYCLNQEDLINEDDEQIFYSPWRKSLRPIRGIYHAAFTFFWAVKLFSDLSQYTLENPGQTFFNQEQVFKIHRRLLEEYFMVEFCRDYLKWSFNNGKVTDAGHQLIGKIYQELDATQYHCERAKKYLQENASEELQKISSLETELTEKKEHYKL